MRTIRAHYTALLQFTHCHRVTDTLIACTTQSACFLLLLLETLLAKTTLKMYLYDNLDICDVFVVFSYNWNWVDLGIDDCLLSKGKN